MREIYVIETGTVTIEAKSGIPIFESQTLSLKAYEDLRDAVTWIESRYDSPKRISYALLWQTQNTKRAYCIKCLILMPSKEEK